ncbi:MAG: hypothetical protein H0W88_00195 [Parachlamydiaceae bacterium]|nr:hypothetical protein [Parachlamydiaceae bacterium]
MNPLNRFGKALRPLPTSLMLLSKRGVIRGKTIFRSRTQSQNKKIMQIFLASIIFGTGITAGIIYKNKSNKELFNLDNIYNEDFQFSYPRKLLEELETGKALDNKVPYTEAEKQKIKDDVAILYQKIISKKLPHEKIAMICAGSPGSGKTVVVNQILQEDEARGIIKGYICFDDVAIKALTQTYIQDIIYDEEIQPPLRTTESEERLKEKRLKAYNTWRPASHYTTQIILANLIKHNYPFALGSTSSSPQTWIFFDFLKKRGYSIHLIHVAAPDWVRWESIKLRDTIFVQTTHKDIVQKGELVPQRINDTFLKYASRIDFYYHDQPTKNAVLGAVWTRNDENVSLTIINTKAYEALKNDHDDWCKRLKRPDLMWDQSVLKSLVKS